MKTYFYFGFAAKLCETKSGPKFSQMCITLSIFSLVFQERNCDSTIWSIDFGFHQIVQHLSFFLTYFHTSNSVLSPVILLLSYPFFRLFDSGKPGDMKRETSLFAHPVNAMCLQFSPNGKYFAVGSADALVSIWDADEFVCLRTQSR